MALLDTGRFTMVENAENADAVLTGAASVSKHVSGNDGNVSTGYAGVAVLRLVHRDTGRSLWNGEFDTRWSWGSKSDVLAERAVEDLMEAVGAGEKSKRGSKKKRD